MRAYVFTDKSLSRHAGRFVWLSLNSEKASNAPAIKKLGVSALPTMFVVDPADEHVAVRWVGGATVAQLDRLFDAGVIAVQGGAAGDAATQAVVRADRAYGLEKYDEAIPAYEEALKAAPEGWAGYSRVVEALLFAYSQTDKPEPLVTLAQSALPKLRGTPSGALVAASGLDGAVQLPADHAGRAALVSAFEAACREALADPKLAIAGDDRSGLYFSLEGARDDAKDSTGVVALEREHVAMLEREAAAAKSPEQRAVYDSHRLSLYLELGTPEKAVPMLEQSERDFPTDYNPPQRLATAYKAMQRWPEALAASDRAMSKAYGPRQFLLYNTRADILLGMGDRARARAVLQEALDKAEAMPEGQRSRRTIEAFRKRLAGLDS